MATADLVARAFDAMVEEYDDLRAPWYQHGLATIDEILVRELQPPAGAAGPLRALDVGCGTGIQSLRLASFGYQVLGLDTAPRLLARARAKLSAAGYSGARFVNADAVEVPAADASFDVANCCGSTLSLVTHWRRALSEMARCLKPGGRLLLEVEGRWNPDVIWEILSAAGGNALGYDRPLSDALGALRRPWRAGAQIDYSFKLESGGSVMLPLKLFTSREIKAELEGVGLRVRRRWGIHSLTNLFWPSTVLHRADVRPAWRACFGPLAWIERRHGHRWPLRAAACSLVLLAEKPSSS
jgi:ubiquinone/menaquinone biosynthesis C-methylase UbiE